jgi:hypothetical protein
MKVVLHRDRTGDYFAKRNGHDYRVEKGCIGWNIFKDEDKGRNWEAWGFGETLAEVRSAIATDND